MIRLTLLTAVLNLSPLVASAASVPLQYVCEGADDNISVHLHLYFPNDEENIAGSTYVRTTETVGKKKRLRLWIPQHLDVQSSKPVFVKSNWNGSEFFIDLSDLSAEYHGVYYFDDGIIDDYQLGIHCLPYQK